MTPTEKLAIAIQSMWGKNTAWCHSLTALQLVAVGECTPSPALDAVNLQVEEMRLQCQEICRAYDKLRSLTGTLELEQGSAKPRFYVDPSGDCAAKEHCLMQRITVHQVGSPE